ncbi:MAG: Ryanodine receptor Ryr [Alistipes sp.]|nr:Ryanodine receptor Ryr [Alistipes sp.]
MKEYTPKPVDISDVELDSSLMELVEVMAKNVHDVWAETRIKDGWRYGETRNDERLEHPCLIPYEELPDSEREYDRNTAIGTLKLIHKLGFKITKA